MLSLRTKAFVLSIARTYRFERVLYFDILQLTLDNLLKNRFIFRLASAFDNL